jgi:tetratricopeptide (TPR) repeat protein
MSLYKAHEFLTLSMAMDPDEIEVKRQLAEVSYLLGKYDLSLELWNGIGDGFPGNEGEAIKRRIQEVQAGQLPRVPAVDYLEAIGGAFALYQEGEYEEAAAILDDVLADSIFVRDFPVPEVHYLIGMCCRELNMPKYAEDAFKEALKLRPEYEDARKALAEIS